jgi:hypothetical protein
MDCLALGLLGDVNGSRSVAPLLDTEAEMIRHIHHRVMSDGITNIQAVLTKPDDPEVAKDAEWV